MKLGCRSARGLRARRRRGRFLLAGVDAGAARRGRGARAAARDRHDRTSRRRRGAHRARRRARCRSCARANFSIGIDRPARPRRRGGAPARGLPDRRARDAPRPEARRAERHRARRWRARPRPRAARSCNTSRCTRARDRPASAIPTAIGLQALRLGDSVGEHTVYFAGPGERVELAHRAFSRDNFAAGALRAARWVIGRTPGLYAMRDVLALARGTGSNWVSARLATRTEWIPSPAVPRSSP